MFSAVCGFGWQYGDEDIFIVQTAGTKDYFLREHRERTPGMHRELARESSNNGSGTDRRRLAPHSLTVVARC
jgi:hypothetical protein